MKRPYKKADAGTVTAIWMLILYALLIFAVLILTLVGSTLYCSFTRARNTNEARRSTVAYLQSKVQAADEAGCVNVKIETGSYGTVLVLTEGDSGFETRIFVKDGYLTEALVAAQSDSMQGETIAKAGSLSAQWLQPNLLQLQVDDSTALVCTHAGQATGSKGDS